MTKAFPTDPETIWLASTARKDRDMRLVVAFSFVEPDRTWTAPKDYVVDGASIPRALWSLVGSPYTGFYRRASIVHDWACGEAAGGRLSRKEADKMFYRACRAGGCTRAQAILLYVGVRIGAWYHSLGILSESEGPVVELDANEQKMIDDYKRISTSREVVDADDDADAVDRAVDHAAKRHFAARAAAGTGDLRFAELSFADD